jgi:hypothetical protein
LRRVGGNGWGHGAGRFGKELGKERGDEGHYRDRRCRGACTYEEGEEVALGRENWEMKDIRGRGL